MRIPNTHKLIRELIQQFGLKLEPFENTPHAYFVADKRIRYTNFHRSSNEDRLLKSLYSIFDIKIPKEMKASAQLMVGAMMEPLHDFRKLPWKNFLAKYDQYSFKHWMAQYANVSEAAIVMGSIFYNIEPWLDNGLVCNILLGL